MKKTAAQLEREIQAVLTKKLPEREATPEARQIAEELDDAAYDVFRRGRGTVTLTRAEFEEEVRGLLIKWPRSDAELVRHINALYKHLYGGSL